MSTRKVVLCADDYAMSAGVSRAILELADLGRISATSAMTNMAGWAALADDLAPFRGRIGLGLHLTLTWGAPLGPMPRLAPGDRLPPLGSVVRRAVLGRLPLPEIEAEIGRQLAAFAAATGYEPDFVDGHQHVHALPGIRVALLAALARRPGETRPWIRDPADSAPAILARGGHVAKAAVVAALSAGFGAECRRAGYAVNRGFSGFSGFAPDCNVADDMERALRSLGSRSLVMCHPGHVDGRDGLDDIVEARRREYDYLASPAFAALLARQRITLTPSP